MELLSQPSLWEHRRSQLLDGPQKSRRSPGSRWRPFLDPLASRLRKTVVLRAGLFCDPDEDIIPLCELPKEVADATEDTRLSPFTPLDLDACKDLWFSVLWRAICDYVRYSDSTNPKKYEYYRSAERWIFREHTPDRRPVITLDDVCYLFRLDKGYIRRKTRELTKNDLERLEYVRTNYNKHIG